MSESEFVLALDMGMSRIAAATSRLAPSGDIEADSVVLGHRSGNIAAVAYVTDDGDLLFGDAAEQRGFERPDLVLRAFTRSIGDDVPLLVGDRSVMPEDAAARLVVWVRDIVAQREGCRPAAIALTHPSSWSAQRTAALRAALSELGVDGIELMTSAEAVVHHHDWVRPLEAGDIVAVYDLGGNSFESTVLSKDAHSRFAVLGRPLVLPDQGGSFFDDAVLQHAITTAGVQKGAALEDTHAQISLARLRRASIAAKHALSFDAEATIAVPEHGSTVRITRSELEAMIEPALDHTLDALERSITSAGRSAEEVAAIILVGGSTQIPLVAQRLSDRFDRPLVASSDAAVALGAAHAGMSRLRAREQILPSVSSPAARPEASERGRRLGVLRPAFAGLSMRTATRASIVTAAVVLTAGVTAGALASGVGDGAPDAVVAAIAPKQAASPTSLAAAALMAFPPPAPESTAPVTPAPPVDPSTDMAPEQDVDEPLARRSVRRLLLDADSSAPSTHIAPPPASGQTTPPGATPVVPAPADPPAADPPTIEPPVEPPVDTPPVEEPPEETTPVDPPPADPLPAEEPAPAAPAEQAIEQASEF